MDRYLLRSILGTLSSDAMNYFFPGFVWKEEPSVVTPKAKDSEIRFRESFDDEVRFSIREEKRPKYIDVLLEECALDLPFPGESPAKVKKPRTAAKRPKVKKDESLLETSKKAVRSIIPEPKPIDLDLDERTKALVDEIEALQKKYGVTIKEIEAVLSYRVKLSHLRITKRHEIILDDFDHQEVKMDTLTKAVFLLYLKHDEGIRYKDLYDHKRELESIYMSISGRSDLDAIKKSISDLIDSIMSNSINEKVSKARKAFRDIVDERIARFYFIDGEKGAAKRIALDRSLVIWE